MGIVGGGNDVVRMTGIASATDYLEIKNGIGVGSPLHVLAEGASANIGVHLQPKGSGLFTISDGTDFNKGIRFRSSSSAASAITLLDAVSTAGRVITLPDATGTLALVSGDLGTPSALVGTNITGTASGLTAGNATLAATVTVANEATDTTCFPLFATAATGSLAALSNAGLTFNSATGLLSAPGLAGAFNGTVGATTPSTGAFTTVYGTSSGTFGASGGTSGSVALVHSNGAVVGISLDTNAILSLPNFSVNNSAFTPVTGIGIGASQGRFQIATTGGDTARFTQATGALTYGLPSASGTLLLADGSGANLTALNASNVSSGTLAAARGGTGVSNTGTITLGGNLVTTGAFNTTFAQAATTTVTLPSTSATMARTDAAQTFTGTQTFGAIAASGTTTLTGRVNVTPNINCLSGTLSFGDGTQFIGGYDGGTDRSFFFSGVIASGSVSSLKPMLFHASNHKFYTDGGGSLGVQLTATQFSLNYTADSTNSTTGAMVLSGGLGVAKAVNIGTTLAVTGATTLSAALITTPEALAPALNAGAACAVTKVATGFALNGVNALTLANGTNGQIKTIVCTAVTAAGTATLTPTTCSGFTTVAFTAAGQTLTLQYFTTGGWVILSVRGATPS